MLVLIQYGGLIFAFELNNYLHVYVYFRYEKKWFLEIEITGSWEEVDETLESYNVRFVYELT